MGSWVTLHLIDEDKFLNEVIPSLLSDTNKFKANVTEYLRRFHLGGTDRLNEDQLLSLVTSTSTNIFNSAKKFVLLFNKNLNREELSITEREMYEIVDDSNYDFARFFEYSVFNNCADFFPHVPLGKAGFHRICTTQNGSLINSIVETHHRRSYMYSCPDAGIECWIPSEDTALLYYCLQELKIEKNDFLEVILNMLEVAYLKKMGLIIGRDLREEPLEKLPQNKIMSELEWNEFEFKGRLIFKR